MGAEETWGGSRSKVSAAHVFSLVTFQGPMNAHRWPDILRAPRVRDTIPGVMYQSLPQFEADILQTLLGVARVFVDRECTKRINR